MNRITRITCTLAAAAALAAVAGCGEKPQDAPLKSGAYRGKPDTRPWEGDAQAFAGAEFKRGDKASWEAAMRARLQGQNEYVRIQ